MVNSTANIIDTGMTTGLCDPIHAPSERLLKLVVRLKAKQSNVVQLRGEKMCLRDLSRMRRERSGGNNCVYLFWARLGKVDDTLLTGIIYTRWEEVVLVAITICQEETKHEIREQQCWIRQREVWCFVFQKCAILIFSRYLNASDLFWSWLWA